MAQVGSGQDQGAKAPEEFCGGKRVLFTWSRRVPVLCRMLSTGRGYSSRSDTRMVCMYEYVDVLTQVRIMVEK